MAKIYKDFYYYRGQDYEYEVAVPTPKQFQKATELTDIYGNKVKIVITNFCYGDRQCYAVAMFERLPEDDLMVKLGFPYETTAKGYNMLKLEGKNSRKDIVSYVGHLLRHY